MSRLKWVCTVAASTALAACAAPHRPAFQHGDGSEVYVNQMVLNESSYQDMTVQVVRFYERYSVPNEVDSAHEVPATLKKKGRNLARIDELGPVDFYKRRVYVNGTQVTTVYTQTGQTTVETLPFSIDAASNVANWSYELMNVQGGAAWVRFHPQQGSGAVGVVNDVERLIDGTTGVSLASVVHGAGGWTITTTNSNVQPVGGGAIYMPMEQLTVFQMGNMRLLRYSEYSNVQLNTGIPDSEFFAMTAAEPSSKVRYGFLPVIAVLGSAVYLLGRRRSAAAVADECTANRIAA